VIRRTSSAVLAVLLLATAAVSACSPEHPPTATSTAPAAKFTNVPAIFNEVRFVWTAAPGIDLERGVAVAVRGYYESREMAQKSYDLQNVYPGFSRAVTYLQPDVGGGPEQANNPGPFIASSKKTDNGDYDGQPLWGNVHFRILSITQPHNDVQAIVCIDDKYLYAQLGPNDFAVRYVKPDFRLERVDLSDHAPRTGPPPPASPTAAQRGPLPAPLEDVFGPWHVQGLTMLPGLPWENPDGTVAKTTPGADEWTQQCHTDLPLPADQRTGAFPLKRDTPPPVEPASPGWPGPST
jgi:hypothetical protein